MFGSQILELGIGLVFIYFIFSLIASAITEAIASIIALRASTLEEGVLTLLGQNQGDHKDNQNNPSELANSIFGHGMVQNLGKPRLFNRKGLPSYLPANRFANAFLDSIINKDAKYAQDRTKLTMKEFTELTKKIDNPVVEQALSSITAEITDDIQAGVIDAAEWLVALRSKVENWYDEMMERVSGWYKRSAQIIIFISAFLITFAMNVDTIMVANILWNAPTIRGVVTNTATEFVAPQTEGTPSNSTTPNPSVNLAELQRLEILGWSNVGAKDVRAVPDNFWGWVLKIIGLIITAFALTLGAPFWFDLLSKLVNLRGSGNNPVEKDKDSGVSDSTKETPVGKEEKAKNRDINNLKNQLDMLQANLRDQFINIISEKLSDEKGLLSLTNFNHRKLTGEEIKESKKVLGDKVDYKKVKVFEGNDLPNLLDDIGRYIKDMPKRELTTRNAITLGNNCFMGRNVDQTQVLDMSWLIHELTHVWQFQSSGWEYLWKAWEAQQELKGDAYNYGGEGGLSRLFGLGFKFNDFNPEQQGQIVQDYYKRLIDNEILKKSGQDELDISIYQRYINQMI